MVPKNRKVMKIMYPKSHRILSLLLSLMLLVSPLLSAAAEAVEPQLEELLMDAAVAVADLSADEAPVIAEETAEAEETEVTEEPVAEEPEVTEEPVAEEPEVTEEPVDEEPEVTEEPVAEEPEVTEEPVAEEPAVDFLPGIIEPPVEVFVPDVTEDEVDFVFTQENPEFTEGLVYLEKGTTIYADEQLTDAVAVMAEEGVAYATVIDDDELAKVVYAKDEEASAKGYIDLCHATPLSEKELDKYLKSDSTVQYEGMPLFALAFAPEQPAVEETVEEEPEVTEEPVAEEPEATEAPVANIYEMETYGFPGVAFDMSKEMLEIKQELTDNGVPEQAKKMKAGKDYVADEIIVFVSSRKDAEAAAAGYNAELIQYNKGMAVLKLSGDVADMAVMAGSDQRTRLHPSSFNYIMRIEDPHPNGGNIKDFSNSVYALDNDVPVNQTWEMQKGSDPFLATPSSDYESFQYMHSVVDTYAAWPLTTGKSSVKVAIIDGGVQKGHEDLPSGIEYIDTTCGVASSIDDDGHGTHIAGIIAAQRNTSGGAGIAPGVKLMVLRNANSEDEIQSAYVIDALEKAADNGAWVINMSFGGYWYDAAIHRMVQECLSDGIALVAAGGNDSRMSYYYPANYSGVINVSSTDPSGQRAPYSSYGSATLSAPGSYIISTAPDGGYVLMNGTSMAAPVVTGIAALYYSAMGTRDLNEDGTVSYADVLYLSKKLQESCAKPSGKATGLGAGIVNAGNLFRKIVEKPGFLLTLDHEPIGTKDVPSAATLAIYCKYNGDYIVYTVNGKNPSVKNGEVVEGTVLQSGSTIPVSVDASGKPLPAGNVNVKALSVNAQGVVSKVATFKYVLNNIVPETIRFVNPPESMAAGKGATLKTDIAPVSKTLKAKYYIVSGSEYASVNLTSGKVTVQKTAPTGAAFTVRAEVAGYPGVSAEHTVKVVQPVSTLAFASDAAGTLPVKALTVKVGSGATVLYPAVKFADGTTSGTFTNYEVKVSKEGIANAVISSGGRLSITGLTPGSVSLTLTALDGSSKKASVKVTVQQPVTGITLDAGPSGVLAYGKAKTFKAAILPANATNKKVVWSLSADAPAGVKISSTGKLTLPNTASLSGKTFSVLCTAQDGSGVAAKHTVTIASPLTSVALNTGDAKAVFNNKGVLTSATLFTRPLDNTDFDAQDGSNTENQLQLTASTGRVTWSSNKTSVATVSANGLVTAVAPGAAVITCTTADGTNKKATVKVNVITPASRIALKPDTSKMSSDRASIAYGKTLKHSVTFGNEYGKPGNTKVNWSFRLLYSDDMTPVTAAYMTDDIKVSSTGLTVAKKDIFQAALINSNHYFVEVTATTADGSNLSDSYTTVLTSPPTVMKAMPKYFTPYYAYNGRLTPGYFGGELYYPDDIVTTTPKNIAVFYFVYNGSWIDFTVTSSKPEIASVVSWGRVDQRNGFSESYYGPVGNHGYQLFFVYVKGDKPGSATIKVTSNDGSNKTASFKVKVVN